MDNHPIPQDVAGFQFKLIGNMTVKQFAYLASGLILAWIFLSINLPFFVKIPLVVLFSAAGVSLAFIPLEGRPLDTMLAFFVKALFVPNQFLYQKIGGVLAPEISSKSLEIKQHPQQASSKEKLNLLLQTTSLKPKNQLDEKEQSFFNSISQIYSNNSLNMPAQSPMPVVLPMPDNKIEEPEKKTDNEALIMQKELEDVEKPNLIQPEIPTIAATKETDDQNQETVNLEKQLLQILEQKQQLEQQLQKLKQNFQPQPQPAQIQQTQLVRPSGAPLAPDAPNLILGVIKDPRSNVLPNILVEIKDNEGNPVRAFKTNKLGQFASATSLFPGTYTMWFEDPSEKQQFDPIQISLTNEIISPFEIISKDQRENLRKALFSN